MRKLLPGTRFEIDTLVRAAEALKAAQQDLTLFPKLPATIDVHADAGITFGQWLRGHDEWVGPERKTPDEWEREWDVRELTGGDVMRKPSLQDLWPVDDPDRDEKAMALARKVDERTPRELEPGMTVNLRKMADEVEAEFAVVQFPKPHGNGHGLMDDSWRRDALCRELVALGEASIEFWFPPSERPDGKVHPTVYAKARRICDECPVRYPCLQDALDEEERTSGMRGAATPNGCGCGSNEKGGRRDCSPLVLEAVHAFTLNGGSRLHLPPPITAAARRELGDVRVPSVRAGVDVPESARVICSCGATCTPELGEAAGMSAAKLRDPARTPSRHVAEHPATWSRRSEPHTAILTASRDARRDDHRHADRARSDGLTCRTS